jgi:hypothetical protein
MGMYDTVFCKKKLPLSKELKKLKDIKWEELDFQTKDLECTLTDYEITKSGKLRVHKHEREWVDDENAFLKGYLKSTKDWWEDEIFTGTIDFYTGLTTGPEGINVLNAHQISEDKEIEGDDWWVEFTAEFVKGKLTELKLLKATSEPAKIRIMRDREWALERIADEKLLKNRIRNFLRKSKTYCNLTRSLYRNFQKLSSKIQLFLIRL